jgi:hypothetical protein
MKWHKETMQGIDPERHNEILSAMVDNDANPLFAEITSRHGGVNVVLIKDPKRNPHGALALHGSTTLLFNKSDGVRELTWRPGKAERLLPGDSQAAEGLSYILRHEYGHHIDSLLFPRIPDSPQKWEWRDRLKQRWETLGPKIGGQTQSRRQRQPGALSHYASTNETEGFAEAFAVGTSRLYDRSQYDPEVADYIDEVVRWAREA